MNRAEITMGEIAEIILDRRHYETAADLAERIYFKINPPPPEVDLSGYEPKTLFEAICKIYNTTPEEAKVFNRKGDKVRVRAIYCYFARLLEFTTVETGLVMDRDHATVIHHHKKYVNWLDETKPWFRPELKEEIDEVAIKLTNCK